MTTYVGLFLLDEFDIDRRTRTFSGESRDLFTVSKHRVRTIRSRPLVLPLE